MYTLNEPIKIITTCAYNSNSQTHKAKRKKNNKYNMLITWLAKPGVSYVIVDHKSMSLTQSLRRGDSIPRACRASLSTVKSIPRSEYSSVPRTGTRRQSSFRSTPRSLVDVVVSSTNTDPLTGPRNGGHKTHMSYLPMAGHSSLGRCNYPPS